MQDNLSILISKLDEFIRKYYKNQLIRGLLLSTSVLLIYWLFAALSVSVFDLSAAVRTFFFFSFVGIFLIAFGFWIVDPLVRFYRLGKVISYEKAAEIVGAHFPGVNDKVLNTLQLGQQADLSGQDLSLIHASIRQRVLELRPVPFTSAIDLTLNKKYLRFLIPPVLVGVVLLFAAPSLLTDGTFRLVNYNSDFEPTAPFRFVVENEKLEVIEQKDFALHVKLEGESIPAEVSVETPTGTFKMERSDKLHFTWIFRKVSKNIKFRLLADGFRSKEYELNVLPNPSVVSMQIQLDFPKYTGMANKNISNTGDLIVPEGTMAKWIIRTRNTKELKVRFEDTLLTLKESSKDQFVFSSKLIKSGSYVLQSGNDFTTSSDSLAYFVNVVPDQVPSIQVEEAQDTVFRKRRYFAGQVNDDYGFTRLSFQYRFVEAADSSVSNKIQSIDLPVSRSLTTDRFVYFWDMAQLPISPGDQIEYYFVVWDNDGIHGPKSRRSATLFYKAPTLEELSASTEKNNEQIKDNLEAALKEAEKLSKEIKQVKQEFSQKKTLGWQDKAKLENLMSRQMELQEKIDQIKEQNKQNNMQKSEFTEMDEQLLEKQKQLEELFDKVMTDELKKLYEELQKLMEQMNKNDVQQKMDNVEMSQEELQKELDRSLELFKQLEVEQKMDEITKKLEDLAKKQEQLSEETREKTKSQEDLQKEQEELNDMFKQVKEDFKELNKLNEELEDKKNIPNPEESMKNTEEQMQNSSQELQNNKNKKASESQKKAAEEMKKMQQQMESAMSSMSMEQNQEDMNAIRQLLENLIKLSLDQEDLMQQLASTRTADPKFLKLAQEQRKLEDDAKVIEDSLLALSKRQIAIQSIVNQEIGKVKANMAGAKENMEERNIGAARTNQQYVMTSLNNLALLLDQALQQMQSQARSQSQSSGSGSCNNPGGKGKGKKGETPSQSMESIRKMQEELAKTLEQMKKNMEGQNPNGQKPGQKPGQMPGLGQPGQGGMSAQEMAELAAKQEALRKKLDELGNKMNEDGSGSGNGLKKIAEEMEKNEKDIVNLNITRETMMRQQEIMTKLLESEKALREKEQDEKRESNEAKNQEISNSFQFLEYKSQKEKEVELLRTIPPALTLYYKMRVNDYFNIIEK